MQQKVDEGVMWSQEGKRVGMVTGRRVLGEGPTRVAGEAAKRLNLKQTQVGSPLKWKAFSSC